MKPDYELAKEKFYSNDWICYYKGVNAKNTTYPKEWKLKDFGDLTGSTEYYEVKFIHRQDRKILVQYFKDLETGDCNIEWYVKSFEPKPELSEWRDCQDFINTYDDKVHYKIKETEIVVTTIEADDILDGFDEFGFYPQAGIKLYFKSKSKETYGIAANGEAHSWDEDGICYCEESNQDVLGDLFRPEYNLRPILKFPRLLINKYDVCVSAKQLKLYDELLEKGYRELTKEELHILTENSGGL